MRLCLLTGPMYAYTQDEVTHRSQPWSAYLSSLEAQIGRMPHLAGWGRERVEPERPATEKSGMTIRRSDARRVWRNGQQAELVQGMPPPPPCQGPGRGGKSSSKS